MNTITTTQLRTQTPELLEALLYGQSIDLIHRSQVVGEIKPKKVQEPKHFDAKRFDKLAKELNLKPIGNKQAMKNYREHLMKKYGKGIS